MFIWKNFILQKNINFSSFFSKIHFFFKVKRGVSIDFFKKNNFSKNIIFILYYQKDKIADKKKLKKKFTPSLCSLKLNFHYILRT
jgi:hypothetical protein